MAGTAVTHLIIFIAALGIATGLIIALNNYANETQGAVGTQTDRYNDFILTSISIDVVSYDNETNITHVYVRNTGEKKLKPALVDVYMDGVRISDSMSNRSIVPDTEMLETGIWNTKEVLHIEVKQFLNSTKEHEVRVITDNSFQDSETFSV